MRRPNSKLTWMAVAEAAAADLSLYDRSALLDGALLAQFGRDESGCQRFWIQDVFSDYVIARNETGALYRIGYSLTGDDVTLTDAQEVETAYVPIAEAGHFVSEAADSEAANDAVYPVSVLKAGWGGGILAGSSLPHYYPPAFVAEVAEAANSAKFGRRHPQSEPGYQYGENDPDRIAGWFSDGAVAATVSEARANLNLLESETALRGKFAAARKARKLDMFGLSILATVSFAPATIEGKKCLEAKKLGKLYSIDLVGEAGAGGRFLQEVRVAASADASGEIAAAQLAAVKQGSSAHLVRHNNAQVREDQMKNKQLILRVLEALRSQDAISATAFQTELNSATEDKYDDLLLRVTEALSTASTKAATDAQSAATATLAEVKKLQFANVMEAKLTESKLPEPAKKLVREHFAAVQGDEASLATQIISVREAFAAANNSGRVSGIAALSLDGHDMAQIAMDRMLGVKGHETSGVIAFHGIREAYSHITGDFDLTKLRASGATFFSRVSEAVSTTDFPNLLLNSMTKRLLQDYAELGIDGMDVLYQKANIDSYKLQDRVRDGYFPELSAVAEGDPYTEIVRPTDERVNYAVGNYGNMLTISEQTIRNDDLGAIARFPTRLARAGRKTLKRFITNYFLNNPAYMADGVSWFNAAHNNLGAAALSQDALIALEIALFQQTEKDSGEQLGLTLDWLMVPIQVKALAIQINQTNTAGANTFFHRFGDNNERIIVNEMLTDDNDFYGGTNQVNAPFLEIGFLDGLEQPQIFLANNPVVGTQFTNDQLQYKVKHVFGGAIIDYRGVQKNVVAG